MRKTLAGIGTLSLLALSFAYCNSDLKFEGTADLAVSDRDLSVEASISFMSLTTTTRTKAACSAGS